tara:strand:- start:52 stop:189 length:138 start_codon:yes stop_codon:yes gene_type:complete
MPTLLERTRNWFFELIEDAVGEETMKKYKNEIELINKPKNEEEEK